MAAATLLFVIATLAPAPAIQQEPEYPSVLSDAEKSKLNKKVRELFGAKMEYDEADANGTARARQKTNRALRKAREAFNKEWEARVKSRGDLLKNMGDLQAVFDRCFPYKRESGTDKPKTLKHADGKGALVVVPKTYKQEKQQYMGVVVLAGYQADKKNWAGGRGWFADTWEGSSQADQAVLVLPGISRDLDLDPAVDLSTEQGDRLERERIGALFRPFRGANQTYNLDRARSVLDCGRGAAAYGLRIATYFPSRFAGIILRDAPEIGDLRLGSLFGAKVLVFDDGQAEERVGALAKALNERDPGSCTVVTAKGAYPYKENLADVDAWLATVRRDPFQKKVVLAPNHDSFQRGYWVEINRAEALASMPADKKPYLEVQADREKNRITVKAVSVENFTLYLNDALVDLDKEITIEINGKAVTQKRGRSLSDMMELVYLKFDPGQLFTTRVSLSVPRGDDEGAGAGK